MVSVLGSRALHEQLSVVMEALTRAAVLEICELVDGGYSALQREINRSRKENDDLRKKLHLIESIVVRGNGLGSGGGGPVAAAGVEVEVSPAAEDAKQLKSPQKQRDDEGGEAAAGAAAAGGDGGEAPVISEELPDVVLIKDEDSDNDDTFEKGNKAPVDGCAAPSREAVTSTRLNRHKRRTWEGNDEAKKRSSPEHLPASSVPAALQKKTMSVYAVDSPHSEPSCSGLELEMEACESLCSYPSQVDPDIHMVQDCSLVPPASNRQMYFSSNALMESQSSRAELDLNLDPAWTKQSKALTFAQIHQNENLDGNSLGLKLISVSGSTSTDCQLSENSNSAFEYEDGEMMSFTLYGEQAGRAQLCEGQPGVRRKRFICSLCNKMYATAQNLDVHMRLHTGERPFSCSQCGKKFTQSAHLKSHLSVHTGERPYACSLCSRSFVIKYSLKLHMKKCHPNI